MTEPHPWRAKKELKLLFMSVLTQVLWSYHHLMHFQGFPSVATLRRRFWRWVNEYSYDKVGSCD